MSYDVNIELEESPACTHCGREAQGRRVFDSNYTSNIAYAMYEAADAWFEMQGEKPPREPDRDGYSWFYGIVQHKRAGDMVAFFNFSADYLERHEPRLREREPANGWGSVIRCAAWLRRIERACAEFPSGRLDGSA